MKTVTLIAIKEAGLALLRRLPWKIWLERLWSRIVATGLRKLASYKTNLYTPADAESDIHIIRERSTWLVDPNQKDAAQVAPTLPEVK